MLRFLNFINIATVKVAVRVVTGTLRHNLRRILRRAAAPAGPCVHSPGSRAPAAGPKWVQEVLGGSDSSGTTPTGIEGRMRESMFSATLSGHHRFLLPAGLR